MRFIRPVIASVLLVTACGGSAGDPSQPGQDAGLGREVLVSAAASLTDAFTDVAAAFEAAHPGTDVVLNIAGSSALRTQILEGAPADVYASADRSNMGLLADAGAVEGVPVAFARNVLQIAVPEGNPAGVTGLEDFGRNELLLGVCAAQVPCGDLAGRALARAGVTPAVDTAEANVRALLTKVAEGELDAAITYATDVISAAGVVDGVAIPDDLNVPTEYEIAVMAGAPHREAAGAFVSFVRSPAAAAILHEYGFLSP